MMQEEEGETLSLFQQKQAKRLKKLAGRLRPFLASKSIPALARLRIFRSIVEPIARWGLELVGWTNLNSALKKSYTDCVKALVGSDSKNTIYSKYCLSLELGIPLLEDLHMTARARAFYKFRTLKTLIAELAKNERVPYRKLTWTTGVPRYLKAYPKLDLDKPWVEAKGDLAEYLLKRRDREYSDRVSVRTWNHAGYASTVGFWRVALFHPGVSRGMNWVVRARCSGIWTVKRAIKFNLIDVEVSGKCAACMVDLGETPEVQHLMLGCTKYDEARRILEEVLEVIPGDLTPDDRIRVLLGGSSNHEPEGGVRFSLGQRWSGGNSEGFGEPKLPGFALVAKFLGLVLPDYMVELWRWRIEPDAEVPRAMAEEN